MADYEIEIRPYEDSDAEAVIDISLRAWRPIFSGFKEQLGDEMYMALFADWEAAKRVRIIEEMSQDHGYVAVHGGRVVGLICYRIHGTLGEICSNAVEPECRGNNIAPRMYSYILDRMREDGCKTAFVETGADAAHGPARRAYEKAGFDRSLGDVRYYQKL